MPSHQPASISSVLTPAGRGAVATIVFEGDCTHIEQHAGGPFRAASGRRLSECAINSVVFGHWGTTAAEDVVVCRVSDLLIEIHCHGGTAAVQRIQRDLADGGGRTVSSHEFSNRHAGIVTTEIDTALLRATTTRTALILLRQHSGLLEQTLHRIESDWRTGEDMDAVEHNRRVDALLGWSAFGLHLSEPWNVVLAGRPNVGKSSLINALVGFERSIVFDQPGTTRDVVTTETAMHGWPVRLSDTAGLRTSADELESAGIHRARGKLESADLRLIVLDTSLPPESADFELLAQWPDAVVIAHKSDCTDHWGSRKPDHALAVSSKTREGIATLIDRIAETLVPIVPHDDTPVPVTPRQVDFLRARRR